MEAGCLSSYSMYVGVQWPCSTDIIKCLIYSLKCSSVFWIEKNERFSDQIPSKSSVRQWLSCAQIILKGPSGCPLSRNCHTLFCAHPLRKVDGCPPLPRIQGSNWEGGGSQISQLPPPPPPWFSMLCIVLWGWAHNDSIWLEVIS